MQRQHKGCLVLQPTCTPNWRGHRHIQASWKWINSKLDNWFGMQEAVYQNTEKCTSVYLVFYQQIVSLITTTVWEKVNWRWNNDRPGLTHLDCVLLRITGHDVAHVKQTVINRNADNGTDTNTLQCQIHCRQRRPYLQNLLKLWQKQKIGKHFTPTNKDITVTGIIHFITATGLLITERQQCFYEIQWLSWWHSTDNYITAAVTHFHIFQML